MLGIPNKCFILNVVKDLCISSATLAGVQRA